MDENGDGLNAATTSVEIIVTAVWANAAPYKLLPALNEIMVLARKIPSP